MSKCLTFHLPHLVSTISAIRLAVSARLIILSRSTLTSCSTSKVAKPQKMDTSNRIVTFQNCHFPLNHDYGRKGRSLFFNMFSYPILFKYAKWFSSFQSISLSSSVCFINLFHDIVQLFPSVVLIIYPIDSTSQRIHVQCLSMFIISSPLNIFHHETIHDSAPFQYHLAQLPGAKTIDPGASFPAGAWARSAIAACASKLHRCSSNWEDPGPNNLWFFYWFSVFCGFFWPTLTIGKITCLFILY